MSVAHKDLLSQRVSEQQLKTRREYFSLVGNDGVTPEFDPLNVFFFQNDQQKKKYHVDRSS
jgi:hypothetical protein